MDAVSNLEGKKGMGIFNANTSGTCITLNFLTNRKLLLSFIVF